MFAEDALRVELDHAEIDSGDAVTGRLVLALKKPHTGSIRVEMGWRITGKGNKSGEVLETQDLFTGELEAGAHAFPFAFPTPHGPFSYAGTHMDIEWSVKGRADIPWKIDPKAIEVFKLNPGEVDSGEDFPIVVGSVVEALKEDAGSNMILAGIGLVMFLTGLGLFSMSAAFGVGSMLVGLGFAVPLFAKKPIGKIQLSFEPKEVRSGMPVNWKASFKPKPGMVINNATVVFQCREIVTKGDGRGRNTWTEVVFRHEEKLPQGANPPFEGRFEVPHLFSLLLKSHRLYWTVGLDIDIARWPDFHVETEFLVLPPLKQFLLVAADDSQDLSW
jgi:hypothetical protein